MVENVVVANSSFVCNFPQSISGKIACLAHSLSVARF